jgi:ABC-type transport system substrate-binding protein
VELADESQKLRYADRVANYIENQDITSEELYYIGLVGHSPASNGTIVVKNNFRNVPERAVNLSALQNPGSGRTVQFFFKGGKNDAGY